MPTKVPPWKLYERDIHQELSSKYPGAVVLHDTSLPGLRSGIPRQIDILLEEHTPAGTIRTIVEAKYHSRAIDVQEVETFIGTLNDVAIGRGVMISPVGYTKAAMMRAYRDDVDVDLDIFTLQDFKEWQADLAIPFAGRNGAMGGL
jgi:hypothetical protein